MVIVTALQGGYGTPAVTTAPWATRIALPEDAIHIWVLCKDIDKLFSVPVGATAVYASPLGVIFE